MSVFNGYLNNEEINLIRRAAISGGLLRVPREVLLNGIPGGFVGGLSIQPAPVDQFALDLVVINKVERMADGEVPIVTFLQNAVFELRAKERAEARVIERLLSRIGNLSAGVPELPDPATLPEIVQQEAIIGNDDMVDAEFLSLGWKVAKAVARIRVPRFENGTQVSTGDGSLWIQKGTAWLIAPGLAITNYHVVASRLEGEPSAKTLDLKLQAENALLEFDFDRQDSVVKKAAVATLVAFSQKLDYALLEISNAPLRSVPSLAPTRVTHDPTSRMAVNIVQHPRGETKRVALRNNLVTASDAETIRYFTDTDAGSSGSPVCDDRWRVVALHRGAREATGVNYKGKDIAYVNFGSQIWAVLDDVRSADLRLADRIQGGGQ